jgi:hypothetical protein
MLSKSLAFVLLSCVTSAEHAAAIEGDLLEERARQGKSWFVVHLIRTTFALFAFALMQAPLRTLALSAGAVAASCLMCPAVDAAFFRPESLILLRFVGFAAIVLTAVLIGAALARIAGATGVRAAVAASVLLLLLFVATQILAALEQPGTGPALDLFPFALKLGLGVCIYLGPLMFASAWVHIRRL